MFDAEPISSHPAAPCVANAGRANVQAGPVPGVAEFFVSVKDWPLGTDEAPICLARTISTRPIYGWVTHKTTAHKKKNTVSPTFPMVFPYFSNGCPILFQ